MTAISSSVAATFLLVVLSVYDTVGQSLKEFRPLPGISIRALEAVNDSTVWFAADRGVWGHTHDAGSTWRLDSIRVDTVYPQFRSMAVLNDSTVLLLSIASPAYLMRTVDGGHTWKVVYRDDRKDIFFDSMAFRNGKEGMAIGDPINGVVQVIRSSDGGMNWSDASASFTLKLDSGEAMFASSNSNFDVVDDAVWVATGGKRSRVLHTAKDSKDMTTYDVPLPQGGAMTGIYSIDVWDPKRWAVAGGDYDRTDSTILSVALTVDGDRTWQPIRSSRPFFGSCVQFRNANELWVTGHDGTFRFNLASGASTEWTDSDGKPLRFHTLRISPSGRTVWLAGKDGRIARIDL